MKTKVVIFGTINAIILVIVLTGSPVVVLTTVIGLGIFGFQLSLFNFLFK